MEANVMDEGFDDVHIITLKSDIASNAAIEAINSLILEDVLAISDSELDFMAKEMVAAGTISGREYVIVDQYGIEVCIDSDDTENPETLSRALDMVADALDQLDGTHGTIYFSEPKTYTLTDMPWLVNQ